MADQEYTIGIKAEVEEVKAHLDELKEGFSKAKEAAKLFNEIVNGEVSNSLKQAAADAETAGTAVEAAFNPMKLVAFFQAVAAATEKITKFISDTFIYTDAEKKAVEQIKEENKVLLELANRTKQARRERELLEAPNDSARDKLRMQYQIEDQGGSAKDFKNQLNALIEKRKKLNDEARKTETIESTDIETGFTTRYEQATEGAIKAQEELKNSEGQVILLSRKAVAAEAEEAAATAQFKKDRAREAQEAERQRQQAQMQGFQKELDALKMNHQVSQAEEQAFWISKLNQVKKGTALYNQIYHQIAQGQQAVFAESARLQAQFAKLQERDAQEVNKANEKAAEEALRTAAERNKKLIANLRATMEEKMQMVADHDKAEVQLEEQTVEQNFELGRISKQQEIAQLADLKKEEIQIEINHLKNKEQLYKNDAKEIAKIERDIAKLEAEQALVGAKAVTEGIKTQKQQLEQMLSTVKTSFSGFIHGLASGTETFSQAWSKMVQDMASKFIDSLINQFMAFVEHKLMELAFHAKTEAAKSEVSAAAHATDDKRTAFSAAKTAFSETLKLGPVIGPIMAPIAAAAAFAGTMGLGSAEGGQYLVPGDQLTMLHRNEMVLPAGVADRMRGVIEGGGGSSGISVIVNHSVNAVDADSFRTHIRRHANMIGSEVARVLKRKAAFSQ